MDDLRLFLRHETNTSHERVDRLYSQLDLTEAGDYETFLRCNLQALNRVCLNDLPDAVLTYLAEACTLLREDLAAIGSHAEPEAKRDVVVHPTAALYVFGGANFGQQILHRRWSGSQNPLVAEAGHYLAHRGAKVLWDAFMRQCRENNLTQEQRYVIVYSSRTIFDVYAETFLSTQQRHVALASAG